MSATILKQLTPKLMDNLLLTPVPLNDLLLTPVPLNDFLTKLREIIREEIKAEHQNTIDERLLSPDEACKIFAPKISKPTLTAWTNKGFIPMKRIGGRLYYKYSDLIQAGTTLKKYKNK